MAMFGAAGRRFGPFPNLTPAGSAFSLSPDMSLSGGAPQPLDTGIGATGAYPAATTSPISNPPPTIGAYGATGASPAYPHPSTLQTLAGVLGDGLLTATGHDAVFAPIMAQARQNRVMMQRQAAEQAAELQREIALEAWKRANPQPQPPHFWQTNDGSLAQVGPDGQPHVLYQDPTPKTTWLTADNGDGTKQVIPMTASGPVSAGTSAAPGGGAVLPPGYTVRPKGGAASGPRTFPAAAAYDVIVQHESNGRPGVTGPQTSYGRAQGLSQMLPATAQAMAGRLGLPWRPDLMTGTSEVATEYQRSLGRAYFEEGLEKTGNVHDAAQYYHAGPDRRLWGPKTRAYANSVVASLEA